MGDNDASEDVRVTAKVLRRAVDDDRSAEEEGVLEVGVAERVVDHEGDAVRLGYSGNKGDGDEREHGVGGCLDPDELWAPIVSAELD